MMKTIFITGATGLLGAEICHKLIKDGNKIVALKRPTSRLDLLGELANQIHWIMGDVRDIASIDEGMQMADHVIHCAALISNLPADAERMMHINVQGTANVMNSALVHNIKRVLHVSSVAAYGRPKPGKIIDEELEIKDSKDNFSYYRSKFYGEREVLRAHAEGLNVVIINPSMILGGGFWEHEPNALFPRIYDGYWFYTKGWNGYSDVRDVAEIAIRLLFSDISGEKFIVSSENLCIRDFMWMIADEFGVKRPSVNANKFMGEIAWRLDSLKAMITGKEQLVSKEVIEIALGDFRYSNEKIKKELNFEFRTVKETVRDTCALYKKSLAQNKDFGIMDDLSQ